MLELIGFVAATTATGAATGLGYFRSRDWVARRLRYVDAIQTPVTPVIAGVAAAAVAVPLVAVLPLIGGGTAVLFGIGVGAGTRAGIARIRRSLAPGI